MHQPYFDKWFHKQNIFFQIQYLKIKKSFCKKMMKRSGLPYISMKNRLSIRAHPANNTQSEVTTIN